MSTAFAFPDDFIPEVCPECSNTGFVRVERDGVPGVRSCRCRLERIAQKAQYNAATGPWPAPVKLREEDFKSFSLQRADRTGRAARQACERFAQNPQGGILLGGNPGTGKSHLAVAILKAVNRSGHFVNVPELMKRLRATFNTPGAGETESAIVDQLVGVPMLVLDDIGAERVTGYVEEMLYLVINGRESSLKPTVFTTNKLVREIPGKPADMLQDYLSDRTYSRVKGLCWAHDIGQVNFYQLEGADQRSAK
jgi:DNA replication protein DnaC